MKQFFLVWALAGVVLFLAVTWSVLEVSERNAAARQDEALASRSRELETKFFQRHREELEWLSLQTPVRETLVLGTPPSPVLEALLNQTMGLLGIDQVALISASGRVIAASNQALVGTDVSSLEFFRGGMAGQASHALDLGPTFRGLYSSVPVTTSGSVSGLVVFRTDLFRIYGYLSQGKGIYLLDGQDRVFASPEGRTADTGEWIWNGPHRLWWKAQWYRVSRQPLASVPGFTFVSLEAQTWPWAAWVEAVFFLVLALVTGGLVWRQFRMARDAKARERDRKNREALLSNLLEGIAVVDRDGRLVWTNPAFERLAQLEPGAPVPALADLWDRPGAGPWKDVLEGRRPWVVFESVMKGIQGGWTPVMAGFTEADGRFLLSVLDNTERYRSDQLLRHSQKLAVLGQLSGGIAHDLNNMLGVLMGMSDLVKMTLSDQDPLQESVDLILVTLARAAGLTERMLTFARKTPVVRDPVDLTTLLRELRFLARTALPESVETKFEVPEGRVVVLGDENLLLSALLNLVLNAGESMPGGGTVTVKGSLLSQDHFEVSVVDGGTGMDAQTLARIFEPFFTTKSGGKGSGLGLSLVKRTIVEHRGTIDVKSRPGEGTQVRVVLPVHQP